MESSAASGSCFPRWRGPCSWSLRCGSAPEVGTTRLSFAVSTRNWRVPGESEAGWVRQSETRFGGIEARLRDIESRNLRLEDDNSRLQLQLREQAEEARSVIDLQAARIDELTAPGGTALTVPATAPFGPSDALRPVVTPSSTAPPETGAPRADSPRRSCGNSSWRIDPDSGRTPKPWRPSPFRNPPRATSRPAVTPRPSCWLARTPPRACSPRAIRARSF